MLYFYVELYELVGRYNMRILMIRHGEPNYEFDCLTEQGKKEAALLADIADRLQVGTCFVSPLGRARETADYTLNRLGLTAECLDWLEEFPARLDSRGREELYMAYTNPPQKGTIRANKVLWDMLPSYLGKHPEYMDWIKWRESQVAVQSNMIPVYERVAEKLDLLLAERGYVRDGLIYRVEKANADTITFFCHFGITCVMLSHLLNMSPFALWHGLMLAPTSVTEVVTEERQEGIASFRSLRLGDISHLYMGGEAPTFAGRFCERYEDREQRH